MQGEDTDIIASDPNPEIAFFYLQKHLNQLQTTFLSL